MAKLKKIKLGGGGPRRPTDPLQIFEGLTLRGSVENLWTPQGDALTKWNELRDEPNVTIQMPTGGGKTLVGLLAAQAIANERKGKVLYVCPTNQLVEQTAARANEVGLQPAVYRSRSWERQDAYSAASAPCITSYAAAFHPYSKFRRDEIAAIFVDDAHVAINELRSRFTLRIDSKHACYKPLLQQLRPVAAELGKSGRFQLVASNDPHSVLFFPSFATQRLGNALANVLAKNGVDDDDNTKFVWGYLREHLDRCLFTFAQARFEISPPLPVISAIRTIDRASRRVFLTATLPSPYDAARVFGGRITEHVIEPEGKIGAAQKLLVFTRGVSVDDQRNAAKKIIKRHKACIIVPSREYAKKWAPATVYSSKDGESGLEEFRKAHPPRHLLLVARFDGIDLPGDSCRILVLDGLPRGVHLLERFLLESVRIRELRASISATRVVQAIGRIFRSNTDHGVVMLCGDELKSWLMDPSNQKFLPPLLQQQTQLGIDMLEEVKTSEQNYPDLVHGVLSGDPEWDSAYSEYINDYTPVAAEFDEHIEHAMRLENQACAVFWDGNYAEARDRFREAAALVEAKEPGLFGWYSHLAGFAAKAAGDEEGALGSYVAAANAKSDFGRPAESPYQRGTGRLRVSQQTKSFLRQLAKPTAYFSRLDAVIERLQYDETTNNVEQAICDLGELLGLAASRPDKEEGTGPDILWEVATRSECAAFEAKTDKDESSQYTKKEIGQAHDHVQWMLTNRTGATIRKLFVGRHLPVVSAANPDPELAIVELEQFSLVAKRLRETANVIAGQSAEKDQVAESFIRQRGLKWPSVVDGFESRLAIDCQARADAEIEE